MMHDGNDKTKNIGTEIQSASELEAYFFEAYGFLDSREALTWSLDRDGVLEISGLGKVPDFSCGRNPVPPWEDKKDLIRGLVIREGIDEIGIRAFAGCRNLKKAILPETLCRIDAYAFMDCTLLEEVLIPEDVRFCHVYETVDDSDDTELLRFGSQAFTERPGLWQDGESITSKTEFSMRCLRMKRIRNCLPPSTRSVNSRLQVQMRRQSTCRARSLRSATLPFLPPVCSL